MNLYIARNGQSLGPYSDVQLREYVKTGIFAPEDLACLEGQEDWIPLKSFLAKNRVVAPPVKQNVPAQAANGERVFYQEGSVTVTSTRFVVGRQTYAMRNITSVQPMVVPAPTGGPIMLLLLAVVIGLGGLANSSLGTAMTGLVMLIGSIAWLNSAKDTHGVLLRTSGGEVRAIENTNQAFIDKIIEALNDSIMSHG